MEKVSMPPIRLGYVGCGYMAQRVHLPNLLSIPACEVVALAEVRQDLGKQAQSRLGIPKLYNDREAMLADSDLEAVAVSAAFAVQGQIARDALQAGKNVFMENDS
jgi:predicted dehydrogenase